VDESDFSEPTRRWLEGGRHVEVDGLRIFVYERGSGPTILLLHGFPTSCYDWRGVIDVLSREYHCVSFDMVGYGLSDKPVAFSYSLFQQTDVAEGLARTLGIKQAHVVGHDVGQTVHAELLVREQESRLAFRIISSTVLNGSTLKEMATLTQFQRLLGNNETLSQVVSMCENLGANYVEGLKGIMKRPESVTEEDAAVMLELMLYQDGNRRLPAVAAHMRERYLHKDRWLGALKRTKGPIQIVWADGDPVANIEMGRAMSREIPQARYTELSGIGHFLIIEDPATVAEHILQFIRSVPS
jgi:pimeloyl-ACP methyl ester carboxylesterase